MTGARAMPIHPHQPLGARPDPGHRRRQRDPRHGADAGQRHLRGRGDAHHLRAARTARSLILINGAYGKRAAKICEVAGRAPRRAGDAGRHAAGPGAARSGARRPTRRSPTCSSSTARRPAASSTRSREIARHRRRGIGRRLLIDAMSAFGARRPRRQDSALRRARGVEQQVPRGRARAWASSSAGPRRLNATQGQRDGAGARPARPVGGDWRRTGSGASRRPFTSSSRCNQAIDEFLAEGGVAGRGGRYADNCRILVDGMRALGFRTLLPDALQAPIIVTFHMPADPQFVFADVLRPAEGAGLRDLSRQADGRRQLPHRLHRPARTQTTCAARSRPCARSSPRWA